MAVIDYPPGLAKLALGEYPYLFPPPGFQQIERIGNYISTGPGTVILVDDIIISSSYEGWIRTLGLDAQDFTMQSFQMLSNNAPLRDYTYINTPVGAVDNPKQVFIYVPPNTRLSLRGTAAAAAMGFRWSIWGWFYQIGRD